MSNGKFYVFYLSESFARTLGIRANHLSRVRNSIGITMSAFIGATQLYKYPSFLWPVVQYLIPQTIAVRKHRKETQEMLRPRLTERLKTIDDPTSVKPEDMLQWLIDNSKGRGNDLAFQANEHLVLNIAATLHTTGGQVRLLILLCCHTKILIILSYTLGRPNSLRPRSVPRILRASPRRNHQRFGSAWLHQ